MSFMDKFKKLTQPYDDDDDFFEGADPSFKPQPKAPEKPPASAAQKAFEQSFGDDTPVPDTPGKAPESEVGFGSIFGNLGKKTAKPRGSKERTVNFGGRDTQVILFSPKDFNEAGELVGYLLQNTTVVMTLESVPADLSRRLLDFMSGIAFALEGKITPVSAKTYFVTPQNVDILGAQAEQPESAGHYF